MSSILRYYRRGSTGEPLGAVYISDQWGVGWSSYNERVEKRNGQPFTKKMARTIAKGRARCPRKSAFDSMPWKLWDTYREAITAFMKRNGYDDANINATLRHDLENLKKAHQEETRGS